MDMNMIFLKLPEFVLYLKMAIPLNLQIIDQFQYLIYFILFLIYINDVVKISNLLYLILFADDTNIFIHHENLEELIEILNEELNKWTNWFVSKRLSLIVKKTNFILFSTKDL